MSLTMHSSTVRVLLMTSTRTLARGFEAFSSEQEGIEAAVCAAPQAVCDMAEQWNPSVVLLDTAVQVDFTLIRALRERTPHCRVVLWTASLSVEIAHQARSAGVHGVLYKDAADDVLLLCLKAVSAGELWFPRALLHGLLNVREVKLSPRERQLTEMVSRGLSNKQIAAELMISEGTVKVYMCKLFRKIGVHDRYELALHGLRNLGVSGVMTTGISPQAPMTITSNYQSASSPAIGRSDGNGFRGLVMAAAV
jgi:two-component system nitrate/nitrite response regulator NarL